MVWQEIDQRGFGAVSERGGRSRSVEGPVKRVRYCAREVGEGRTLVVLKCCSRNSARELLMAFRWSRGRSRELN